jgi:thiamine biosynthesis lipoprotein
MVAAVDAQELARHEFTERHMAVDVKLTLYAPSDATANDAAARAFARIAALDRVFSDFDPESETMRLCRDATADRAVPVSAELFAVLEASQDLSRRSEGAFDVTISPVIKLWRRARRQKQLPDPVLLAEAKALVDYRQLVLDPKQRSVRILKPGVQLDFGGIAKGYAAQEAIRTLNTAGITRALVAIGGDIAASDAPPNAPGWKVGVAPLDRTDGPPSRWLKLVNAAVSTSGDAFQFVEIGGVKYSHIVDPKTGVGLTHSIGVTVIAPNGLIADGVDTAAAILGPDAGLKFIADTPHAAGLIATMDGERVVIRTTKNFDRWEWP